MSIPGKTKTRKTPVATAASQRTTQKQRKKEKKQSKDMTSEEKRANRECKKRNKARKRAREKREKESKKQARIGRAEAKRRARIKQKLGTATGKWKITEIKEKILDWLTETEIDRVAEQCGYTKKHNQKIIPIAFVLTLAFASFGDGAITYSLLAMRMFDWFGISTTTQALCLRISSPESVLLLEFIYKLVCQRQLIRRFKDQNMAETLSMFKDVILEDSTVIQLNERVSKSFKGSGGNSSKSSMKLNVCLSTMHNNVRHIDIVAGAVPDQSFAKTAKKHFRKGELWIRDLGYFNLQEMSVMDQKKAFFLSRLKKDTNVYLNRDDVNPINVFSFLENATKNGQTIDQTVYIGQLRLEVRLVGEKVGDNVRDLRIARYKKEKIKRDKKKQMNADYIQWFSYSIFITNVPQTMIATPAMVMAVYKTRWQIELFFKRIKSVLKIHVIKGESKNRVLSLIYAKLIALLTAQSIVAYAKSICDKDEELSEHKLFQWLKDGHRLGDLMAAAVKEIEIFLKKLIAMFYLFYKNKRKKRQSTQQML